MLKILIVDDENDAIEALEWKLNRYVEENIVIAKCSSPKDAVSIVDSFQPDILFLDIHMPEMNGFEFLMHLNYLEFNLIFTTAYDEMAIRVSRLTDIFYILKPVDKDDLLEVFEKAKAKGKEGHLAPKINLLKKHLLDYTS
ncbi:MAG: response regulator [Flavobacteriaceae bacterium]|nr:response regulator [Flavobacteriaceae bacterium]